MSETHKKPPHSIKVPKLYKVATSILKDFKNGQGSVKTLVYDGKKKHPNVKALLALVSECLKHEDVLEKTFKNVDLLKNEPKFDKSLALILATELLYGKKTLPGESKPVKTLLSYHSKMTKFIQENDLRTIDREEHKKQPRYVRVNLLKTSMDLVLTNFSREYGFVLNPTPENYEDFIGAIQNLKDFEFMKDFHLGDYLLVFPSGTHFYDHPWYLDGSLILQDKASCLPVACLNPLPGSVVIDACAAPGMKTSQALANIYPDGKCIAVERNAKRYKTLNDLLEKHVIVDDNVNNNIETICEDFLKMNPDDFANVEYIMVDPTCSGSGLSTTIEKDAERITKLSNLQVMILKHALKFRGLKRCVYSTCSIFDEENIHVIEEVLKDCGKQFKLVKALPTWNRRCAQDKCLKVDPEKDLCAGFFVAVLKKRKKFRETTTTNHDIQKSSEGN